MRKYLVAVLAIPVLAVIYIGSVLRGFAPARAGTAIALGAIVGLGAMSLVRPEATTARPESDIVPLTQVAFRTTVDTGVEVDAPVTIEFTTPMDPASVEAAIAVDPPTPVDLRWDEGVTTLTITPSGHWAPATYHTVTVQAGALAASGRPTTTPARSSFLTRGAAAASLAVTAPVGRRAASDTAIAIAFDRPVDLASVRAAIRVDPPVDGAISVDTTLDGAPRIVYTPSEPLAADTRYTVTVEGVVDEDGVPLDPARLVFRTAHAPQVVRFRPRGGSTDIARTDAVSVRFTTAMDRASTKAAFTVTANGAAVAGKVSFAEGDTVLVFDPAKELPWGAKVVATVAASARSAAGASLAGAAKATFQTVEKPKPRATTPSSGGGGGGGGGGGSVGSGNWGAVERYYLRLMNCTRTGGWVDTGGHCDSPGGRNVAPLKLSTGISSKVSRPYAKLLATRGACSHFIGGNPGDRLRRAGYTNYVWAENLGCRCGNPYSAVLGSHRFFQSEKSYNGGHYVNLMNAKYDRAGIGVWVSSGRVRLVVDFYHP